MTKDRNVSTHGTIQQRIFLIRDQRVMLDFDLAELYGVEVKALNQAVARNKERFPSDFMFQLSTEEWDALRSQTVTAKVNSHQEMRRNTPRAFTQEGVAMLSSVLRSERAIAANIQIMRTFVHIREAVITHKDLALRLDDIERKYDWKLDTHDRQIDAIFNALRQLIEAPVPKKRRIGFVRDVDGEDDGDDYGRPKGRRR